MLAGRPSTLIRTDPIRTDPSRVKKLKLRTRPPMMA
jgi:hypothetical protein